MDRREEQHPNSASHRNRVAAGWLVLLLALVGFAGFSAYGQLFEPAGQAPAFTLTSTGHENRTLGERVQFSLSDYAGKTVLLDMMAVTCTSCRVLTEEVLIPVQERYGHRDDFVILSIDTWADPGSGQTFGGETREDLIELQMSEGVPWRHALDTDDVYLKYSAISLPKIVLVDPSGQIVLEKQGLPALSTVTAAIEDSFDGQSQSIDVLRVGLIGLAFFAGVASFFAPCSVGLIPAYMGVLLQGTQKAAPAVRFRQTLVAGTATAAGIVTLYGALALLFWQVGGFLRPHLTTIQWVTGVLLVVLGLAMLRTGLWDAVAAKLGMGRVDGRRGFFAFGVGYGLAAFGCTGPIFLPVLFQGFVQSTQTGFTVFLVYAFALAGFMLVAAALVASGQTTRLRGFLDKTKTISRVSAVFFVVAGVITLWIHQRAEGTWFPF